MPEKQYKLILINPFSTYQHDSFIDTNTLSPPLALGIIAALTPSNWDIEIIDENFDVFEFREADLVGITALTSAVNRAYTIASIYRERNIPVVLGGIHASMLPEESLQYADTVVIGEAEGSWQRLISDFEMGNLQRQYKSELSDLRNLPVPRRDLFHRKYTMANLQTSRGCPMNCEFCSVHTFNGNRYRQRPVNEVLDELETITHENLFLVDDNIIGYSKASTNRAIELFKGIKERGIKKDIVCQASLNFGENEEVLKTAAEAGIQVVLIGIESEKVSQLEEANKKLNLKIGVDNYNKVFKKIQSYGIGVLGTFIFGLDTDTVEDLYNRADYIMKSEIDAIQSTIMTPLPGTRLFDKLKLENRLIYTNFPEDWEHYFFFEVVHRPKLMSPEELTGHMKKIWEKLYNDKHLYKRLLKSIQATRNVKAAVWSYYANVERHNLTLTENMPAIDMERILGNLKRK